MTTALRRLVSITIFFGIAGLLYVPASICAQATLQPEVEVGIQAGSPKVGTQRALIICGLPGSEDYQTQFLESAIQIRTALTERLGFEADQVRVQFGSAEPNEVLDQLPTDGRATREEIAAEAKRLVQSATVLDTTWVFVIGHAYFDGKHAFLNIPDRDLTQTQFGKLFSKLQGQAAFFICAPVSGFYTKGLSGTNRVVMTSTEADRETNGSIFHQAVAKAMTELSSDVSFDIDKNGTVSVLDLYLKSTQNLSELYMENDPPLIPTEHPQLDDNGDGKGSELQVDYLTEAQGGRSDSKRKRRFRKFKDGVLAASLTLALPADNPSKTP